MEGRSAATVVAGGAAVAALTVHAAPLLTSVSSLRRRWLPALAGVGAADHVALTFDDGPDPTSTPAFLEALDGLGWKATFFLLGSMAEKAPSVAAELVGAGHEIGLHGYEHHSMLERTPKAAADDIGHGLS